jgi:hypothetical protein
MWQVVSVIGVSPGDYVVQAVVNGTEGDPLSRASMTTHDMPLARADECGNLLVRYPLA